MVPSHTLINFFPNGSNDPACSGAYLHALWSIVQRYRPRTEYDVCEDVFSAAVRRTGRRRLSVTFSVKTYAILMYSTPYRELEADMPLFSEENR